MSLGAYRVFGCDGSIVVDVIVAALERAYADGMQIINQSLGAARQWPQYPTAQASTRLVNKGVIMVTSTGNNGPGGSTPDALFAAGAPGTGAKVIATASYDNRVDAARVLGRRPAVRLQPRLRRTAVADERRGPWSRSARRPPPMPVARPPSSRLPGRPIALIRRGTCGFNVKTLNAQAAGASAVVIYNNVAGPAQSITVASTPPVPNPIISGRHHGRGWRGLVRGRHRRR